MAEKTARDHGMTHILSRVPQSTRTSFCNLPTPKMEAHAGPPFTFNDYLSASAFPPAPHIPISDGGHDGAIDHGFGDFHGDTHTGSGAGADHHSAGAEP